MSEPAAPVAAPDAARDTVRRRLSALLGEVLDQPDLDLAVGDTAASVPGWDSLNHISFVIAIEREYRLRFRSAEVARLQNVGEVIDLILQRVSAG